MDKASLFEIWAPSASPWSRWAKPALFAHFDFWSESRLQIESIPTTCVPAATERSAVVAVLPGPSAVVFGLELARIGYRPVPLFNSCPPMPGEQTGIYGCVVDAGAILAMLVATAPHLAGLAIPADAPPAFLIDSARSGFGRLVKDDLFDNRSIVFAADFPSVKFLRDHAITSAVLVNDSTASIGKDVRFALRHWPAGGLPVVGTTLTGEPLDVNWPSNGFWAEFALRWNVLMSFHRNSLGGFGAFVPKSSG